MPAPSNAEDFFRKIFSQPDPYSYIESFVSPETGLSETEWLEFKGADKISDADAVKHWSKALSGFANTGGGVMIWGIDARKDKETKIDRAGALALVPWTDQFRQRLLDVLLNAVDPPLRGVEITAVSKTGQKEGFVVCLIPEGTAKAHRAESADKQFYMRIADNFVVPPVTVIRNLFLPRSAPYLIPNLAIAPMTTQNPLTLWICLRNAGNLTAKNISLVIHRPRSIQFDYNWGGGTNNTPTFMENRILLNVSGTLNPDMRMDAVFGFKTSNPGSLEDRCTFIVKTSCEDAAALTWDCRVPQQQVLNPGRIDFTPVERMP